MNTWSSLSDVLQHEMRHEVLLGLAFELIGNCSLLTAAAVPTFICCTLGRIHAGILRERHVFFSAALRATHSGGVQLQHQVA